MLLPFSHKGSVVLYSYSSGNNTTITVQVQNSWDDKKPLKTRHVAGMSNFKNEKRIILIFKYLIFLFAFENPNALL